MNVMNSRNLCFPGFHVIARAKKGIKHKEIAFDMVIKILGKEIFPTKILKSGPRKGTEVFVDEATDMSDSWVIGKSILNFRKQPEKQPKKNKKNVK